MKPTLRQACSIIGIILAVLTFWTAIPLVVPVLFVAVAVLLD